MPQTKLIPLKSGITSAVPTTKKLEKSAFSAQGNPLDKVTSVQFTYELPGLVHEKTTYQKKDYDVLSFPNAVPSTEAGNPDVPQEGVFVAIPSNATNVAVKVVSKKTQKLEGRYALLPAETPVKEIEYLKNGVERKANSNVFGKDVQYPGTDFKFLGVKEIDGVTVAHFIVYPVQYNGKTEEVTVAKSIQFEVNFELKGKARALPEIWSRFSPVNANLIVGLPEIEISQDPEVDTVELQTKLYQLNYGVQIDWEALSFNLYVGLKEKQHYSQMIIITTAALVNAVEPFRKAKSHAPYNAVTITTEKIVAEFPAANLKQSIKDFLSFAYKNWIVAPQYVVIAADTDLIPMHVYNRSDNYASDHFYADINGNLCPEIIVSRFPSSNYATLESMSKFFAEYVDRRGADWQGAWLKKVLLVAYQADTYKNCMNDVYNQIHDRFSTSKLYGDSSSEADVKNHMNNGDLVVHYRGHGSETNWSSANGLETADINALSNGSTPPFVFNVCCQNGHVDDNGTETVAEAFTRNLKAVATIAASRDSWTHENNIFSGYLWEAIMEGEALSGRIFMKAKTKLVLNNGGSAAAMDNLIQYNLFGDPTAPVISSADWLLGNWNMEHDGWVGTLQVKEITSFHLSMIGGQYYSHWHWKGIYKSGTKSYKVNGTLGGYDANEQNAGSKQSNHKISFFIPFDPANQQYFRGYVFTWTRKTMAGYTWWDKHPFGWYAKR